MPLSLALVVAAVTASPPPSVADSSAATVAGAVPTGYPIDSPDPNPNGSGLFGLQVTALPDTDGDRRDDFAVADPYEDVAAPNPGQNDGRVYVFSGATTKLLWSVVSPQPAALGYFGDALAGVPDVNGDGRGELLVGAWGEPVTGQRDTGHAYLFSGATGQLLRSFVSPNAEASTEFGWSVAGVADVDGDGAGDVSVSAPFETVAGQLGAGRGYLFSGRTGALLQTLLSPNPQVSRSSFFGGDLSSGGDLDGDGRGDVIVGADQESLPDYPLAGRAYVFSGASGAVVSTLVPHEPRRQLRFGRGVSAVPDTTGDGVSDIVVGNLEEHPFNQPRALDVFNGATGAFVRAERPTTTGVAGFGRAVAGVPDVDGDGLGDVVAGAEYSLVDEQVNAGRAFAFGSRAESFELRPPVVHGGAAFGSDVAGLADIDGDGLGDVVVGAAQDSVGAGDVVNGAAYLFRSSAQPFTVAMAPMSNGPVVIPAAGGSFGFRLTLTNFTDTPQQVSVWTDATVSSGAAVGPLYGPRDVTILSGKTLGPIFLEQDVPAAAPAGEIVYRVTVRTLAGDVNQTDQFVILKEPGSWADDETSVGWSVHQLGSGSAGQRVPAGLR